MGFLDKLKNIFFEEDEEDDEDTKEVKKEVKHEEKIEKKEIKNPVVKKVELSKNEKVELSNDNKKLNESKSLNEGVDIPFSQNNDEEKHEEIKYNPVSTIKTMPKRETRVNTELIFDYDDFVDELKSNETKIAKKIIKREEVKEIRKTPKVDLTLYNNNNIENKDKKETKTLYKKDETKTKTFVPSPIISPIYGILDKNYKKDEVKENKDIRIKTRPSKMDLDTVRNKAFGELEYDIMDEIESSELPKKVEVKSSPKKEEVKDDIKKLREEKQEKPVIDKVTLKEADEYYTELGLAYDTDYKDLSKDLNDGKVREKTDDLEDNLFDLIESMYNKEE